MPPRSKSKKRSAVAPEVRKQTDASLHEERVVADESLAQQKQLAAQQADRTVEAIRAKTDETLAEQPQVQPVIEETIEEERRDVDKAVEREREVTKSASAKVLRAEREKTDTDLGRERRIADASVERVRAVVSKVASERDTTRSALSNREEFLTFVSRDLKEPLLSIVRTSDLMIRDIPSASAAGGAESGMRAHADRIGSDAREALRLIGDLLERIAVWKDPDATGR